VEVRFEQLGERLHRGGLGKARDAFHQHVAVAEQRDQEALRQRGLAHHPRFQRRGERCEHLRGRDIPEHGASVCRRPAN
jgi:hypothetical protein